MDVELELFKQSTTTWQPNQCYELYIKSPYANPLEYESFSEADGSNCYGITAGLQVACNVKPGSTTTLQFQFPQVDTSTANMQSVRFLFSNFKTPFSSQVLTDILVRSYSDAACSQDMQFVKVSSVTTQPAYLPSTAIEVSSSSNILGDTDRSNTLTVAFTPQTQMAPGGAGKIEIGIPNWYVVGTTNELMYNPESLNECQSVCMEIVSSILQVGYMNIRYENMNPDCISGAKITIQCTSFYNPIWQDRWYGFYVNTYDNESPIYKPIEKSDSTPFLDATQYEPSPIPISNFFVTPSDSTINTVSEWTFHLEPQIPMQVECYIKIYLPLDFEFSLESVESTGIFVPKNLQTILSTDDVTGFASTDTDPRQSMVFQGCYKEESLGLQPSGRIYVRSIGTQRAVKDSDQFDIEIYKDEFLTQKIAKLEPNFKLLADDLQTGWLDNLACYPLDYTVQESTLLYFNFTTSHNLYSGAKIIIQAPPGLKLPQEGRRLNVISLQSESSGAQDSIDGQFAFVKAGNQLEILGFVQNQERIAPYQFRFAIQGIENQISAKDAGGFGITTYFKSETDTNFYLIDTQTVDQSFVATPGLLDASGQIVIDLPRNNADNTEYSLVFAPPHHIPQGGYIKIEFPDDLVFVTALTLSSGTCVTNECVWTDSPPQVVIKTIADIAKEQEITIQIGGIKNPRTFKPTGSFVITSYDTDGVSLIDNGFRKNTAMTIAGEITEFSMERQNEINGGKNDYIFTVKTDIPLQSGDKLQFYYPQQLSGNAGQLSACVSTDSISCELSGTEVQIVLNSLADEYGFSWTITNVLNPPSNQPSDPFREIQIISKDGWLIAEYKNPTPIVIVNTVPGQLLTFTLDQESFVALEDTSYTLTFTPVNPLPSTGAIRIVYPEQIKPSDGAQTGCFVTTNQVWDSECTFDTVARTIDIKNVFTWSDAYQNEITIHLVNMTNPIDNRPSSGFDLTTYSDANQVYVADKISNVLEPKLQCDFPCGTCPSDDRANCTSCFQHPFLNNPKYLMIAFDGDQGRCEPACDYGFTTDGDILQHKCAKCDPSCTGCNDNSLVGDKFQCDQCSVVAPFRMFNTQLCLTQCTQGIYEMDSQTCGTCDLPCQSCQGSSTNCTGCIPDSALPNLHEGTCIATCPAGTTSVAGICEPCKSPCKTCDGQPEVCTDCDLTEGRNLLFAEKCYSVCPAGFVTDFINLQCVGCLTGCDLCLLSNTSVCTYCGPNLALYETQCRGNCPEGMQARERVCVTPSTEDDLLVMYFPFLIASIILIVIVLFGKLKKKPKLIDAKLKMISLQNSIPTINAWIAPLQTLCTISQCALSIYFGYYIHFALALAIWVVQIVFNITYLYWFLKHFYSKYIPEVGKRVFHKTKTVEVTADNQHRLQQDTDPEFAQFVNKHGTSSYFLFALMGGCHFKAYKMFYSHYMMFDMFKAKWTRAKYLRVTMAKWQLAYLCLVDLLLIAISIFGLATITWNNQLWIIMLESILLAILVITLDVIERYQIVRIFQYTENPTSFKQAQAMNNYKKRLNLYQAKISKSKHYFKDRKMEDLLIIFGVRKCKSFFEVRDGFEKQEDSREVYTWPISPGEETEMMKIDIKFNAADAYEQWNNVYCEGVTKPKKKDMNIQAGEPGRREFQNALDRKQNDMLSTSQLDQTADDLLVKMRTARRRGRKNKYYNQIEQEDGDDNGEADEQETYLRLIQQQEEEEEMLKNIINESTIAAKEVAADRKIKRKAEKAKVREEEAALQRKIQYEREVEEQRIWQEAEQKRLLKEERERRKLQDEIDRQEAERAAIEAEEMRLAIEASFLQRRLYEEQEMERIKAIEIEKQRQEEEAEKALQAKLLAEKIEKEETLARLERERIEEDRRRQEEVRKIQMQQELIRKQEKEAIRVEQERIKAERHAREEAEREALRVAQEQAEEEARVQKEMERARQQQIKQAQRAQKQLEKEERIEAERLAKELRHQQEEILRQGQHDQKVADRKARDEADRLEKHEVREAAKVYAKHLQQPISYDLPSPSLLSLNSPGMSPKVSPKQSPKQQKSPKQKKSPKQQSPKAQKTSKQFSPREAQKPSPQNIQKQFSMKDLPADTKPLHPHQQQLSAAQLQTLDYPTSQFEGIPKMKKMRSIAMSDDDLMNNTLVAMNQDAMQKFKQQETLIMCPPNANLRMFNEHDVLGDVERDDKANVVVLEDKNGRKHDKKRHPVNQRGYMVDPKTGDVIENMTGQPMFQSNELDEKGELPAPYCIEKYNFNPHQIMGDFDYSDGKPTVLQTNQGFFVDKRGRRVNANGWYIIPNQFHLIDNNQRKKFDKRQLVGTRFDDLPKLFNFQGKRFDIRDVMGEFEKDQHGNIQLHYTNNGSQLMDSIGRLCNEKGYLIDGSGNIIDRNGRQLWKYTDLKSGEFIKIFPFLKFNLAKVQGELTVSQRGNPILEKQPNGGYLDRKGRPVNVRGYLVDRFGNVIDIHGKLMFDKAVLETDGEIPSVFRSGLLRQDTASSISRLMSEIERQHGNDQSDFGQTVHVNDSAYDRLKKDDDGDTSVDSKMEDTPANYNLANQRYEHDSDGYHQAKNQRGDKQGMIPETTLDEFAQSDFTDNENTANPVLLPKNKKKPKKKAKKPKISTIEFLEPTSREKNMAGAYGGEAKPELRRPRVKYDKDRLATSKKFRIATADEPRVRAQLNKLQNSTSSNLNAQPEPPKKQGFIQPGRESQSKIRKSTIHIQEPDFEQVYGKDIDQFLEDSEWDIDQLNLDKSQSSDDIQHKVTTDLKLQAMEKHYLGSNTTITPRKPNAPILQQRSTSKLSRDSPTIKRSSPPKVRPVLGPDRETIMSVTDNPGVIHRGNVLEFETKK